MADVSFPERQSVPMTNLDRAGFDNIMNPYAEKISDPLDVILAVRFYPNPLEENEDYIEIRVPGDETNIIQRPASEYDKKRFAQQWEMYQNGQDATAGQQLLSSVPWMDKAMATFLARMNIMTVEQLSGVSDANLQGIGMGARKFRDRAIRELQERQKLENYDAVHQELAEMKAKLAALEKLQEKGK